MKYYIANNGHHEGPFEISELRSRGITAETLVWNESMPQWVPAGSVAELAELFVAPQPQVNPPYPGGARYGGGASYNPPMPNTWFIPSLLITILCCMPLGLVGLAYSLKVEPRYFAGQYLMAEDAANKAKIWSIVGLCIGLLFWGLYFFCYSMIIATATSFAHLS